jgi:hypothetical protein
MFVMPNQKSDDRSNQQGNTGNNLGNQGQQSRQGGSQSGSRSDSDMGKQGHGKARTAERLKSRQSTRPARW